MKNGNLPDAEFFAQNRANVLDGVESDLLVMGSNDYMQLAGDQTSPFRVDANFWYLTGVEEPGCTVVTDASGEGYIIGPFVDKRLESFQVPFDHEAASERSGLEVVSYEDGNRRLKSQLGSCASVATVLPPKKPYIRVYNMHLNPSRSHLLKRLRRMHSGLEVEDANQVLASLRSVKQPQEIVAIGAALQETKQLFEVAADVLKTADYEYEIHAELQKHLTLRGLEAAFSLIIASGRNALITHYESNRAKIDKDAGLLLDMGVRAHGYNGDITRTVFSNPTERQAEVYNAVLDIQSHAFSKLKPGITLDDYEKEMLEYAQETSRKLGINANEKREVYKHLTSHHLGINVHDVGDTSAPLVPGNVLTVEPGLYIDEEGIGIRTEDVVVITEDGCKILSDDIVKEIDRLA